MRYSRHSYVVVDAAISSGINVTHYSDENKLARTPFKLNCLGLESDHDFFSKVRDFSHIGPGSVFLENVSIGEYSFIGANSISKKAVKIGKNVIIGAGSVVLRNVLDGQKLVGNPTKII